MDNKQIVSSRLNDYKALGSFIGLTESIGVVPDKNILQRMKEVLAEYNASKEVKA